MDKKIFTAFLYFLGFFSSQLLMSQTIPEVEWDRTYGGSGSDIAQDITPTKDGGFLVAGSTYNQGTGGYDFLLVKIDDQGNKLWDRDYGGSEYDGVNAICPSGDRSFLAVGSSWSKGAGRSDFWVIKMDNQGNKLWDRTYGGSGHEEASDIISSGDGFFLVAGFKFSNGVGKDFWVVKIDDQGNKLWDRTYGGIASDEASTIIASGDGGFLIVGYTHSKGMGRSDFWVVKIDNQGKKLWESAYGGSDSDMADAITRTKDGGFLIAGSTYSKGSGKADIWVVKIDDQGKRLWDRTYGGSGSDLANAITPANDGGFLIAGYTYSNGAGSTDFWVVKIDDQGNKLWEQTYGGNQDDMAYAITPAVDGGFLLAGYNGSKGLGKADFWVIKLSSERVPMPKSPPLLSIDKVVFKDADGNKTLNANDAATISYQITNKGQGTAYKLGSKAIEKNGITGLVVQSNSQPIAKLLPGEQAKITIELQANRILQSGTARFQVTAVDANGFEAAPVSLEVTTLEFQPPELRVADYLFSSATGTIQKSTPIKLQLALQNKGFGNAEEVKVSCKLPENVFAAGPTEFQFNSLAYGEDVKINLEFFTNSKYSAQTIPIKIIVNESYGQYGLIKTVEAVLENTASNNQQLLVVKPINNKKRQPINTIALQAGVDKVIPKTNMVNADAIAVVIGNRDYISASNVDYAINDARVMKQYLTKTLGFKPGNILYYENATLSNFRTLFGTELNHKGKLYNTMKHEKSDVFVFYSGHGAPGLADGKGYFVPIDSDPKYVESTGFPLEVFYQNLGKLPAKHITVVTDACFSGADVYEEISPVVIKTKPQAALLEKGIIFNSSSGDQVSSWYTENQHGLFTWAFLKALQDYEVTDTNNDRKITVQEVYKRIADNNEGVPYYARRIHGIEQVPVLKGNDTNRVLFEY